MLASAWTTTYFSHMVVIPWNQHHVLFISYHSSVWYPVIQYNSSHVTMLLLSFPLMPFHNCHIDLDSQGQYLIPDISLENSPQMWHPNQFTHWSPYISIRWLPTLFYMWDYQVLHVADAAIAFTGVPTIPRRGGLEGGGAAVGGEQEPKQREKIEWERGRERVRGCLKEGFLPLWSTEGWEKGKDCEKTGQLCGSIAAEQVCKTLLADWSYFCSSLPLAHLIALLFVSILI